MGKFFQNIYGKSRKAIYSSLAILTLTGCSYLSPAPKPNLLGEYSTISHKSTALLEKPREKINVRVIHEGKLPIYEGKDFDIKELGDYNILSYHTKNINPGKLKIGLEEQLGDSVEKISVIPETNQMMIRIDKKNQGLENKIKEIIKCVDKRAPQVMIDTRVRKIFADYTKDVSAFLKAEPINPEDTLPTLKINMKGAVLRVPERAQFGAKYGIIGETGRYALEAFLDQLESQGYAEDLANPTLVVSNGEMARVELIEEVPFQEDIFSGGAIYKITKFKKVENFLEVVPEARDNQEIYLNFKAGVGTINPYGPLQIPSTTERKAETSGVTLKQGETLAVAGFLNTKTFGIERKDPWLNYIPVIGSLFTGKDEEKSRNMVLFLVTPYYIDINQNIKKNPSLEN